MELKEIEKLVKELIPEECMFTKVEPEGLNIVIYVKDIKAFYEHHQLIRRLAGALRKKVSIRADPSALMEPEKAKKIIEETVPETAGVQKVSFVPEFSEVYIDALKPGLVIGKGGVTLKQVMEQTSWSPKVFRTPTMDSSTIKGIRHSLVKEASDRKKFLLNLGKKICKVPDKRSEWVKVTALGASREVGRSCFLVETPNTHVLIDCGINPDTSDPSRAFPYLNEMNLELSELDAVVVSHAHLDHSGFVPYLFAYGYEGPVYCSTPTRDLMILLQMDYINIMNKSATAKVPYGIKDIQKQLSRTIPLDYNEVIDISPEVKLTLYNAGHILGSSLVHLHIGEGLHNLVYTGDLKFGFTRLFNPANTRFPRAETVIMESTYGGRNDIMPKRREIEDTLMKHILETVKRGGKVLIPVFAVGRSQEIMLVLEDQFNRMGITDIPVYLDGMILEASAIHTAYPEYLRNNIKRRVLSNNSPFESEVFEVVKQDRTEIAEGDPCVILAPSGMLSGGWSVEYLRLLADDPRNMLIFVGYQSALSLGRKIQRGLKEIPLIDNERRSVNVKINMQVETVEGFSGHSDRKQLMAYIRNITPTPEKIFTIHGDESKCDDLARSIKRAFRIDARAPMNLDSIRLK